MHPRILTQRMAQAQQRIAVACKKLAAQHGIAPPVAPHDRYPTVAQLLRLEGLAAFVEELTSIKPGVTLDEILAVEGLSKTSIAKIKEQYGLTE